MENPSNIVWRCTNKHNILHDGEGNQHALTLQEQPQAPPRYRFACPQHLQHGQEIRHSACSVRRALPRKPDTTQTLMLLQAAGSSGSTTPWTTCQAFIAPRVP
eukprot:135175-Pleurochrysis_carterae.AAC.2